MLVYWVVRSLGGAYIPRIGRCPSFFPSQIGSRVLLFEVKAREMGITISISMITHMLTFPGILLVYVLDCDWFRVNYWLELRGETSVRQALSVELSVGKHESHEVSHTACICFTPVLFFIYHREGKNALNRPLIARIKRNGKRWVDNRRTRLDSGYSIWSNSISDLIFLIRSACK